MIDSIDGICSIHVGYLQVFRLSRDKSMTKDLSDDVLVYPSYVKTYKH